MKETLQTRWKISANVDGGPSKGSCVRRPGSKDPHWHELKFIISSEFNPEGFTEWNINIRRKKSTD